MRTRAATAVLAIALLVAACGGSGHHRAKATSSGIAKTKPVPSALLGYFRDRHDAPLQLKDRRKIVVLGVTVHDVSYAGWFGRPVSAYLLEPQAAGRHPAIVFMHGSGASRAEFVGEALKLARRGIVGLVVDEPWVRSPLHAKPGEVPQTLRDQYVANVVDIRRGIDLLDTRRDVDPSKIGFIGHSYGAQIGGILAGVEPRLRALDLLSGAGHPSVAYARVLAPNRAARGVYEGVLTKIDPARYVGHAAPAHLFIQDGLRDQIVPQRELAALADAASEPKLVKWYPAQHELTRAIFAEGENWVIRELGKAGG